VKSEGALPRVALVTYSTKSRGGVVHTLYLAEALHRLGQPLRVFAMGDPEVGFFRETDVPHTIIPAPPSAPTLEERVFDMVDSMADALACAISGKYDLLHAQDCIAARAATRVRDAGAPVTVVRTVHHVDDFSTPALIDCQNRSILDPDRVLVVSQYWRCLLLEEYGIHADVITNGVDAARFARPKAFDRAAKRARIGANGRFLFLHVGGIEPRKGSVELIEALSMVRTRLTPSPVLAVIGAKPFQDYSGYRDRVFERAAELGLEIGRDLALLESVGDAELPCWYQAADAFVFPSIKEGWGLAVLEAMAAGLPVITSDIAVFREYLTDGSDVLMTPAGNAGALADAMVRVATDADLRDRLHQAGPKVASRFTWEVCARQHIAIYRQS
jgi:glycosyltransferase-like protein